MDQKQNMISEFVDKAFEIGNEIDRLSDKELAMRISQDRRIYLFTAQRENSGT